MRVLLIGADGFLRLAVLLPEENIPQDDYLRPQRLRRSTVASNTTTSGQHSLVGGCKLAYYWSPMRVLLIGADGFLRLAVLLPEENIPQDDYLRPQRLRRGTVATNTATSGQHSLVGGCKLAYYWSPMSALLIGADGFLRLAVLLPEENIPQDDYLRPQRLRRSTVASNTTTSGQHSLVGADGFLRRADLRNTNTKRPGFLLAPHLCSYALSAMYLTNSSVSSQPRHGSVMDCPKTVPSSS